jgi:hypothetical protein
MASIFVVEVQLVEVEGGFVIVEGKLLGVEGSWVEIEGQVFKVEAGFVEIETQEVSGWASLAAFHRRQPDGRTGGPWSFGGRGWRRASLARRDVGHVVPALVGRRRFPPEGGTTCFRVPRLPRQVVARKFTNFQCAPTGAVEKMEK